MKNLRKFIIIAVCAILIIAAVMCAYLFVDNSHRLL